MKSDFTNESCNDTRLNILFLPEWYPNDSNPIEGIFIREHARAVAKYNNVIVLYCENKNRADTGLWGIDSDCIEEGIRTIRISHKRSRSDRLIHPKQYLFVILAALKLLRSGWKPDVIHAHVCSAGIPAAILGKIYKIPVVLTEHWSAVSRHELRWIDVLLFRFAMNSADIILPVSEDLKKAIESYGINKRIMVVPNTVNTEVFYPAKEKKQFGKKIILLVASLSHIKGIPYLLNALASLAVNRDDFILEIIGDGPNRGDYENLVIQLGLKNIVRFHGQLPKDRVSEFMRDASFFVLPSLWENLPCVLIESMASGLPIVATKVGGIPEIINESVGILVSSKDSNALCCAIEYIMDHLSDYTNSDIAKNAKNRFGYSVVGTRLDSIYKKVIKNRE